MSAPDFAPRIVRCPGCGGDALYAAHNPWRPFCSARCRSGDFGAWASEAFAIETKDAPHGGDTDNPPSP